MSKRHFTYFQQFGGSAIEDLDSAIAKLSRIIESLKQVNKGNAVTPSSIVVPPSTCAELSVQQSALVNWDDRAGGNVLHHISSPVALELLLLSVPDLKDRINKENKNGKTPLDIAIINENLYEEPNLIPTLKKYGATTGEAVQYTRATMIPTGVDDVYGSSEKVPSTKSIGSTGKSVGSVKIPSASSLKSMSASASTSTQRKVSTPASSLAKESTKSSTSNLEDIVKRSSTWIFLVTMFGPGILTCTYLEFYQDNESLSEIITNYYFRWNEKDNKLEYPTKLDPMLKKCSELYNHRQNMLFPLIVYKNDGQITYNFILFNYRRSEISLIGIFEKNPIVFTNFDKQIISILEPYTNSVTVSHGIKLLKVSGIDYSIIVDKEQLIKDLIKPISKKLNENYTNVYDINILYLISMAGFTKGHMTIAKFNNMLSTRFFNDFDIDLDISKINMKNNLNMFIKTLNDSIPKVFKNLSNTEKSIIAGMQWSNELDKIL